MSGKIYADHAATTFLSPAALDAMMPYLTADGGLYGNPSSIHSFGEDAAAAVAKARSTIAEILNCEEDEVIFTSGGSEADNQAVLILEKYARATGKSLLFSGLEHHAVLSPANELKNNGIRTIMIDGEITPESVKTAAEATEDGICGGSFMLVNNETGNIFDICRIINVIHGFGGMIHTDAVQAVGHIPVDFKALGADMLSLSAHKFHGPKGAGALICRRDLQKTPFILGGSQERGLRAGTENVPAIVGMAAALSESAENMARDTAHVEKLRNMLYDGLRRLGGIQNGGGVPGILSVRFHGRDGEALVRSLDFYGIAASAGAACNSKEVGVSHVLHSMGLSDEEAASTVRFSLDASNTEEEMLRIISAVDDIFNL